MSADLLNMLKTLAQRSCLVFRSQPAGIPGVHHGPSEVSLSLDCVKLDPVNTDIDELLSP